MTIKEKAEATLKSGITPLKLKYDEINYFDQRKKLLRSSLIIESLDLGTLTFEQYRYVCRRTKKGDELIKRHFKKLFEDFENQKKENSFETMTIAVTPKFLIENDVADIVFKYLAKYPKIIASDICIEISADILFEDLEIVKQKLKAIKDIGVKVSIFEIGDEFFPIFRLSEIPFDYGFVDEYTKNCLMNDETAKLVQTLINFLHLLKVKVFVLDCSSEDLITKAQQMGFDGYGSTIPYTGKARKKRGGRA